MARVIEVQLKCEVISVSSACDEWMTAGLIPLDGQDHPNTLE